MEAKAIKSFEYKQVRQWLSGYHIGYERKETWRVQIKTAYGDFESRKTYASEYSAKRAAKRIQNNHLIAK